MRYIELGSGTGESVPVIGLGTYHLQDRMPDAEAISAIQNAQKAGIYFVDTSDNYFNEDLVGKAIRDSDTPEQFFIATKTGLATTFEEFKKLKSEGRPADTSPDRINSHIMESLARLGVSNLDLYQIHDYDSATPAQQVVQTMDTLLQNGYIRYYGLSNYSRQELEQFLEACDTLDLPRPTTIQPAMHLLAGAYGDQGVEIARQEGMTILAHSPLAKGALQDQSVDRLNGFIASMTDSSYEQEVEELLKTDIGTLKRASALLSFIREYANERGYTLSEYALAWLVNQPATIALNACVSAEHLASAERASEWHLDESAVRLGNETFAHPDILAASRGIITVAQSTRRYYDKRSS